MHGTGRKDEYGPNAGGGEARAIIEFDFRNVLSEGGRRADANRKIGPERCLISEFWTKTESPIEYAEPGGAGAFADAMRSRGFTNRELDLMFKDNPARLLESPVVPR